MFFTEITKERSNNPTELKIGLYVNFMDNKNQNNELDKETNNNINKNKFLKIITKTISFIVWIFAILILFLLIITAVSKKGDVFGYRLYVIMSGSMEPTIGVKDAILTKEVDEVHTGDIIAYEDGNMVVVHRIIDEQTNGGNTLYQTKGDANNTEDVSLIEKSQIKGIVKHILPPIGRMILFIQSNLLIIIIAIFILLVVTIVRRLI